MITKLKVFPVERFENLEEGDSPMTIRDPRNLLRAMLQDVEVEHGEENYLYELLLTAQAAGVLPEGCDEFEALVCWALVERARYMLPNELEKVML